MTASATFNDPKTWAFQEGVESAELNSNIRDNINSMGPHLLVRKTADESTTSTTLQDDDHLVTPSIPANEVWQFVFIIRMVTTSSDPKFAVTFPSGVFSGQLFGITGGRVISGNGTVTATAQPSWNNSPDGMVTPLHAVFLNGATPGTVRLQFASGSGDTVTMKTHSTIWGVRLA